MTATLSISQHVDEKLFRLLVANVRDYAIFALDQRGVILSWNEGARHIKGYRQEEIVGRHFSVFYSKEDKEKGEPEFNLAEALRKGTYESEGWRLRKNGSRFWANVVFTPLFDEKGNHLGFAKITRDLTSKKYQQEERNIHTAGLEKQVVLQQAQINDILGRITDGFIALDRSMRYTYVNQRVCEMVHMQPEDLMGHNVWEVFPEAVGGKTYRAITTAFHEQRYISNQDYYAPLELTQENHIYPSPEGVSMFIRDISAQKKAQASIAMFQEDLNCVFEHTDHAIILFDRDMKIRRFNRNAQQLIQRLTGKELRIGNRAFGYFRTERLQAVEQNLEKIKQGQSVSYEVDYSMADGSIDWYEVRWVGIFNRRRELTSVILTLKDITTRKKQEGEIQRQNEIFRNVAWLASHEVRRPVASIQGLIELMDISNTITEKEELIRMIRQCANELDEIVHNIHHKIEGMTDENSQGTNG